VGEIDRPSPLLEISRRPSRVSGALSRVALRRATVDQLVDLLAAEPIVAARSASEVVGRLAVEFGLPLHGERYASNCPLSEVDEVAKAVDLDLTSEPSIASPSPSHLGDALASELVGVNSASRWGSARPPPSGAPAPFDVALGHGNFFFRE